MKPVFHVNTLNVNIHTYQRAPALVALGAAFAAAAAPAPVDTPDAESASPISIEIPALGEYWPGQGGHNGGFVPARGDVPEHYLIFAAKDVGDHKWGGYEKESTATSKTDGYANSTALCSDETDHPAANAAAEYVADGHNDFHLPAAAELYQGWVNCPDVFNKAWYWSSTQRSANLAFVQYFGDGIQLINGKDLEARVRPVRRLFI